MAVRSKPKAISRLDSLKLTRLDFSLASGFE